jgi:hypothetical protein
LQIVPTLKSLQEHGDRPKCTELIIIPHDKCCATGIHTVLWKYRGTCDEFINSAAVEAGLKEAVDGEKLQRKDDI